MSISATSGVSSGIDYANLIKQLVSLKAEPVNAMHQKVQDLELKSAAFETLSARLTDLKTAAAKLKTATDFKDFTSVSSNEGIVSATVGSSATGGTFSIVVDNLAQSHKIAADGVALETTVVSAAGGSFIYNLGGGADQTVTLAAGATLADVRDGINALKSGVTATIVNDGAASNPERLILTSDTTGASNTVNITQNDTTLAFNTTLQSALDANIKVDNLSIARSTNIISDVITGVTLNLSSADPTKTVSLNIKRDDTAIADKVSNLVNKFNSMVEYINTNNTYDSKTKVAEPFFGETAARNTLGDMRSVLSNIVTGRVSTMDRVVYAGITTKDGKLSFDSAQFKGLLGTNFDDVINLFTDDPGTDGFATLLSAKIDTFIDFSDGRITNKNKSIKSSIDRYNDDIDKKELGLTLYEESLRLQFASLEGLLVGLKSQSTFLSNLQSQSK